MHTTSDKIRAIINMPDRQQAEVDLLTGIMRDKLPDLLDVLHWADAVSTCPAHEHVVLLRKALERFEGVKHE